MTPFGRCIVCGTTLGLTVSRICEQCAHPEKVIVTCRRCGDRFEMSLDDPLAQALTTRDGIPIRRGTAIQLPSCAECDPTGSIGNGIPYRVFQITPDVKQ